MVEGNADGLDISHQEVPLVALHVLWVMLAMSCYLIPLPLDISFAESNN